MLYADKETDSIQKAVQVTRDRRKLQATYNTAHGITPKSASRGIRDMQIAEPLPKKGKKGGPLGAIELRDVNDLGSLRTVIDKLRGEMKTAAADLEYETAAALRDQIRKLEQLEMEMR